MTTGESFYITTPIYYPSDVPHIGHGYTTVAVDTLARWHRQAGDDTWMLTGTDEHGQKMLRAASANGVTPQQWVDKLVSESWFPLLKTLDVANDDFIRTTQERHERNVQTFFQALYDRGYIYAGEYEALYCVGCEEFKPESEIVDGTGPFEGLKVCAIHSKPLELLQEKNYFFKLSEFQDRLLDLYDTDFIQPESARNEVVSFVKQGLKDLSVSRSTFDWGIKVPWDESHVIYVWIDALLNYVDRRRLRLRPGGVRAALAGAPRRRQGHPALPRRDLAGDAHGRGRRGAQAASSRTAGCSSAARRCRSPSSPASRRPRSPTCSAPTRTASTSSRRSRSGRTARSRGRTCRRATRPSSPTASATSPRAPTAMIERYFEGIVPPAGEYTERDLAIQKTVADAAAAADAAIERFRIDEAIARDLDDRRRAERLHHRERAVGAREGRRAARRAWERCCTPRPRVCARSPCCSRR